MVSPERAGYAGRPMALFPPAFLDGLREKGDPSRWPGVLAADEALRSRVEAAVAGLAQPIALAIERRFRSERPGDASFARGILWAAEVAKAAGAVAEALVDESALRVVPATGSPFVVAPAVFQMDPDARGAPEAVQRLVQTLESGFAGRRFALAVRRPIPADFDVEAVARAVTLWVRAVERGDWRGRHAVYDDERLSIELTLLAAGPTDAGRGLTFLVGPSVSLDRLSAVDGHLQAVVRRYAPTGLPLVVALIGEPAWALSRGYGTQLLLGTPDEVRAEHTPTSRSWRGAYHADGFGLFADPQFTSLAGLWWLEPAAPDPLAVRGWAHENPWRTAAATPPFPGARCARVDEPDPAPRRPRVWMAWTGDVPTRIGAPP